MTQLARTWARLRVIEALQLLPGLRVVSPGKWEAVPARAPEARVRATGDRKTSTGRHPSQFTTTAVVEVQLFVNGVTEEAAQDAIEQLCYQTENVVMGYPPLLAGVQQFAAVTTRQNVDTDGAAPMGSAVMSFDIEVFESFDSVALGGAPADDLDEVRSTVRISPSADPAVLVSNLNP